MQDLKECFVGDPKSEYAKLWYDACDSYVMAERKWVAMLRSKGIKAAHPDDGWVSRKGERTTMGRMGDNSVALCYPQFNDGIKSGDFIALGWHDKFRIVRATVFDEKYTRFVGAEKWYFEEWPANVL